MTRGQQLSHRQTIRPLPLVSFFSGNAQFGWRRVYTTLTRCPSGGTWKCKKQKQNTRRRRRRGKKQTQKNGTGKTSLLLARKLSATATLVVDVVVVVVGSSSLLRVCVHALDKRLPRRRNDTRLETEYKRHQHEATSTFFCLRCVLYIGSAVSSVDVGAQSLRFLSHLKYWSVNCQPEGRWESTTELAKASPTSSWSNEAFNCPSLSRTYGHDCYPSLIDWRLSTVYFTHTHT